MVSESQASRPVIYSGKKQYKTLFKAAAQSTRLYFPKNILFPYLYSHTTI